MKAIYIISSSIKPDRVYVGSTKNFTNRKAKHLTELRCNRHGNSRLQNHFNKYGESDIYFTIIETVSDENNLIPREQHYIDTLKPFFNICIIANSSLGIKRTTEYIEKMKQRMKGIKHRPECKQQKSDRQKGWQHFLGHNHSEDAKRKISMNNGRKRPVSQYDMLGVFIKNWDYTKQAADELGINKGNINSACLGNIRSAGGYIWKFSN